MATILLDTQSQGANNNDTNNSNNNTNVITNNNIHINNSNISLPTTTMPQATTNTPNNSQIQSPSKLEDAERVRQRMDALRKHHNDSNDIYNRTQPVIDEQIHDETLKYLKSGQVNGSKTKSQKPRAPKRQRNNANNNNNSITGNSNNNNLNNIANQNNIGVTGQEATSYTPNGLTTNQQMNGRTLNDVSPMPNQHMPRQHQVQQPQASLSHQTGNQHFQQQPGPMQQITLYPTPQRVPQQPKQQPSMIHMQNIHPPAQQHQMPPQAQQQPPHYKYSSPNNSNNPMYIHQQPSTMQSPHQAQYVSNIQQHPQQSQQMYAQHNATHVDHQHVDQTQHFINNQQHQPPPQQAIPQQHGFVQTQQTSQQPMTNGNVGVHLVHHAPQQATNYRMEQSQVYPQNQMGNHFHHHLNNQGFGSLPNDLDLNIQAGLDCDVESIIKHEMLVEGQLDFNNDLLLKLDSHPQNSYNYQLQHQNHYNLS